MNDVATKAAVLPGLGAQPLSSYLGALGLMRMLGSQSGRRVRGAFSHEGFQLTGMHREELTAFLLDDWRPSPVFTPWNNASGFYASSKGQLAKAAIEAIAKGTEPRFDVLRAAIAVIRSLVSGDKAPSDEEKARFIGRLRCELPDEAIVWLDAVSIVTGDEVKMMPLLGSGGNEGVLDYSGLYLRSLQETVLSEQKPTSRRLLEAALFGDLTRDLLERPGGQFDPGTAGGFNTGPGFESKGLPNNPWSFILLVEGTMVWAGSIASRQQGLSTGNPMAVSPFTVRHVAAGYTSAGRVEDNPQKVRAEVWMPVWERPSSLTEIERFIAEGRVEVKGRSGSTERARDSLDFADAVGSLGVDRGVTGFVRYALAKRRGDSYIALPAGRLSVNHRREIDLLRQLDAELDLLDGQFLRRFPGDGPPAILTSLRRNLNDARFDVATRGGPDSMVRLVRSIGALERVLARRDPSKDPKLARPLGGLGLEWIAACGDAPEVRLAAALTSLGRTGGAGGFRSYVSSVSPQKEWEFLPAPRSRSWFGATVPARLASVLARRLLDVNAPGKEAARGRNPTWGARQVGLEDIAVFLEPGLIDEVALEELIFGFTWVKQGPGPRSRVGGPAAPPAPREYALLKLLCLPDGVPVGTERIILKTPPELVPLLMAGRVDDAVRLASAALRARGFEPRRLSPTDRTDAEFGTRLAAALLFPMFQVNALLRDALLPNTEEHHPTQETTDAV